jgi:hypothetical protein
MRCLVVTLAIGFVLGTAPMAPSQSLGDLAKKEKERRRQVQAEGKVITNAEAAKYKSGPVTTVTLPPPSPSPSATGAAEAMPGASKPKADEPTDFQGRPESWWRQTLADARKAVKDLENEGNVLTLRITDLQNQFYREASGFRQQDIQREIQKAFYEQDLNKQNLAKAQQQLAELEKEARKSGALPGWLNPKTP